MAAAVSRHREPIECRKPRHGIDLIFAQREAGPKRFPLFGASLATLAEEYQRQTNGIRNAAERQRVREDLISHAGGLSYDQIDREFRQIHKRLGWPASATLKDFRHLFATCMQNAGVSDRYIQYLMGHTKGRRRWSATPT